jgi:hypothetical protein
MATKYNIYRNIVNIKIYAKFEIFQVKVPLIFLGTQGFSARRVSRHAGMHVTRAPA